MMPTVIFDFAPQPGAFHWQQPLNGGQSMMQHTMHEHTMSNQPMLNEQTMQPPTIGSLTKVAPSDPPKAHKQSKTQYKR